MVRQRTLKSVIEATGVGTHSGNTTGLVLRPAPVNTGIVFNRMDFPQPIGIPAHIDNLTDSLLCTCIAKGEVRVSTIEHVVSALAGMGVDNAYIDLTGPEVPIMDGSAASFVFLIQSAGIEKQDALKKFIRIKERVKVSDGDRYATFEPYPGCKVNFTIDFNHPVFQDGPQQGVFDFATMSYAKEVSRARTFGFIADYEKLRANNLALGASLDNTIVLDEYRILNEGGLRYQDEFVKHKILDAIGDMYLLGHSLIGSFYGYKSGHGLNHLLAQALLSQQSAWEYVTFPNGKTDSVNYFSSMATAAVAEG